jgi:hypothetical protein
MNPGINEINESPNSVTSSAFLTRARKNRVDVPGIGLVRQGIDPGDHLGGEVSMVRS